MNTRTDVRKLTHLDVGGVLLCLGGGLIALATSWLLAGLSVTLGVVGVAMIIVGTLTLVSRAGRKEDVFGDRRFAWSAAVLLIAGVVMSTAVLPVLPSLSGSSRAAEDFALLGFVSDALIAVGSIIFATQFWGSRGLSLGYRRTLTIAAVAVPVVIVIWLLVTAIPGTSDNLLQLSNISFLVQVIALMVVGLVFVRASVSLPHPNSAT